MYPTLLPVLSLVLCACGGGVAGVFLPGQTLTSSLTILRGLTIPAGDYQQLANVSLPAGSAQHFWRAVRCSGTLDMLIDANRVPTATSNFCNNEPVSGVGKQCAAQPGTNPVDYVTLLQSPTSDPVKYDLLFFRDNITDLFPKPSTSLTVDLEQRDDKPDSWDATVSWTPTGDPRDSYSVWVTDEAENDDAKFSDNACAIKENFDRYTDEPISTGSKYSTELLELDGQSCTRVTVIVERAGRYMAKYKTSEINVCEGRMMRPTWLLISFALIGAFSKLVSF